MSFFKGIRNTISNVAQIILIVILLPIIAVLLRITSGNQGGAIGTVGIIASLVGKIPLCDIWVDILNQFNGGLSAETVMTSSIAVILKAFPESIITAVCVYLCVTTSIKLKTTGLPIFATYVGIVIATLITSLTGISGNINAEILADFGVVIIMLIGLKIMFSSVFRGMKAITGKKILLFVIDGLFAVITTAYISGLLMTVQGSYATIGEAVGRVYILTGIELLAAVVVGIIGSLSEKDNSIF